MYDLYTCMLYGVFLSSILYGTHCVLLILSLYVLLYRRASQRPNIVLAAVSSLMFLLETTAVALSFSRLLDAFVGYAATAGQMELPGQFSDPKGIAQIAVVGFHILVADGLLIYRCWIIWGRHYKTIVVNILLLLANIGCLGAVVNLALHETGATTYSPGPLTAWIVYLAIALVQNISLTTMILIRIWLSHKERTTTYNSTRALTLVLCATAESGGLFLLTTVAYIISISGNYATSTTMLDILNCITGLSFSLAVVRIGLGLTQLSGIPTSYQEHPVNCPLTVQLANSSSHTMPRIGARLWEGIDLGQVQTWDHAG